VICVGIHLHRSGGICGPSKLPSFSGFKVSVPSHQVDIILDLARFLPYIILMMIYLASPLTKFYCLICFFSCASLCLGGAPGHTLLSCANTHRYLQIISLFSCQITTISVNHRLAMACKKQIPTPTLISCPEGSRMRHSSSLPASFGSNGRLPELMKATGCRRGSKMLRTCCLEATGISCWFLPSDLYKCSPFPFTTPQSSQAFFVFCP
jgi:hypothetical protein